MARKARPVVLSERQRSALERLRRSRKEEHRLVERATLVVMAADGLTDVEQARRLGVDAQRPRRWRGRWLAKVQAIDEAEAEGVSDRELERLIVAALTDAPRSGTPPKFSAQQVALLISLACEPPEDSGIPVTHWIPKLLAAEAVKRGIVESISPRHLDRILKRGRSPSAQEPVLADVSGQAGGA